jgi:hypothetical protein
LLEMDLEPIIPGYKDAMKTVKRAVLGEEVE